MLYDNIREVATKEQKAIAYGKCIHSMIRMILVLSVFVVFSLVEILLRMDMKEYMISGTFAFLSILAIVLEVIILQKNLHSGKLRFRFWKVVIQVFKFMTLGVFFGYIFYYKAMSVFYLFENEFRWWTLIQSLIAFPIAVILLVLVNKYENALKVIYKGKK